MSSTASCEELVDASCHDSAAAAAAADLDDDYDDDVVDQSLGDSPSSGACHPSTFLFHLPAANTSCYSPCHSGKGCILPASC